MNPKVALIGCIVLVVGLLSIERKGNPAASHALWVPTFWMLISGSRPVGNWFGSGQSDAAGSHLDRLVLSTLILLAMLVVSRSKIEWSRILKDNFWLIFLYLYLAFSILWSDLPCVSVKRWIRLLGLIPIALVVLSERSPLEALESIFRRHAYVLIPFSFVLIKYFPHLGRRYDPWDGALMWVGVGTQKNGLGILCVFSVFFLFWAAFRKWRSGELLKSRSHAFADALVVGIALHLLRGPGGVYSATSSIVLITGITCLLILYRNENLARWMAAHLKAMVVALPLIYLLFSASLLPSILSIVGRDESLTGRTDIWRLVLDIASLNPLLGVGYGSFWGLETEIFSTFGVKQAHNGYLGVYLEVGIVGIVFLFAFLMEFSGKVRREVNHMFDGGVLGICFLLMILLFNYSEDTFLKTSLWWNTMVFLAVIFSTPVLHEKGTDCACGG